MHQARFQAAPAIALICLALLGCGNDDIDQGTTNVGTSPGLSTSPSTLGPTCDFDITWNEAWEYVGETLTVKGPVVDSAYPPDVNGSPTFLNLGQGYPSSDRFTVVIWGDQREYFPPYPEEYYYGLEIAVTGQITDYEGMAQMEATNVSQIEEC